MADPARRSSQIARLGPSDRSPPGASLRGRPRTVYRLAVSDPDSRLVVFDIRAKKQLRTTVTLKDIKADSKFAQFELVRMSRLSVMPVTAKEFHNILKIAGK